LNIFFNERRREESNLQEQQEKLRLAQENDEKKQRRTSETIGFGGERDMGIAKETLGRKKNNCVCSQ